MDSQLESVSHGFRESESTCSRRPSRRSGHDCNNALDSPCSDNPSRGDRDSVPESLRGPVSRRTSASYPNCRTPCTQVAPCTSDSTPRCRILGPNHFPEKLIPLAIHRIQNNEEIPIYGKGENVRDWLYVEDHASAIDVIYHKGELGETYNIGGNNEWTNIDLIRLLCQIMDEKLNKKAKM